MRLTYSDEGKFFYIAGLVPGEDDINFLEKNFFTWSNIYKRWWTAQPKVAARLRDYADDLALKQLSRSFISLKPWSGRIPHPPDLKPLHFQWDAAKHLLGRNRAYLYADPGLGKTIVAALMTNALGKHRVNYVCPPSLTFNTKEEMEKWVTWRPRVAIWGHDEVAQCQWANILVIPDTSIFDPLGEMDNVLSLRQGMGQTFFFDEAHRFKNLVSQRTRGLVRVGNSLAPEDRIYFLSGTAMPNRPMELFPILNHFAPETIGFMSEHAFGMRYNGGYHNGFGYNYNGNPDPENFKELKKRISGKFLLRIKKKDVLKDLPPKLTEMVVLAVDLPPQVAKLEETAHLQFDTCSIKDYDLGALAAYRQEVGKAKVPLAVKFIREILDDTDESILIFAHHATVIHQLSMGLAKYNPLRITGATPMKDRQTSVTLFQSHSKFRVFIGNAQACGVGFTLTKATRVIHVEPDWVPATNDQASDRAHRIGQTEQVLEQYLVFKNSMDRKIIEANLRKRKIIEIL